MQYKIDEMPGFPEASSVVSSSHASNHLGKLTDVKYYRLSSTKSVNVPQNTAIYQIFYCVFFAKLRLESRIYIVTESYIQ